jgi:hypothetical protein
MSHNNMRGKASQQKQTLTQVEKVKLYEQEDTYQQKLNNGFSRKLRNFFFLYSALDFI